MRDVFALQLYEDPGFRITYDGEDIDAREAIRDVTPYEVKAITEDGHEYKATLEIIEWKKKVERKLMLCLPGRFSFNEIAPGIHARGFDFTAYLTADHFQSLTDNNTEGLVELDPPSMALVEASKAKLREHFRERETERVVPNSEKYGLGESYGRRRLSDCGYLERFKVSEGSSPNRLRYILANSPM